MGHGAEHRIHRVLVAVVEKHNVAVGHLTVDDIQDLIGILALPVLGVHRPVHQRHGQGGRLPVGTQAVGRAHPVVPLPQQPTQQVVVFLQVGLCLRAGQAVHLWVVVGMVSHLMPLGGDTPDDVRILHRLAAHHEEGGTGAVFRQTVQQAGRAAGRGAVVKGEGHVFWGTGVGIRRGIRRDGRGHRVRHGGVVGAGDGAGRQQDHCGPCGQRGAEELLHQITGGSICAG